MVPKCGGPCRIRTCGLRIRSPTLYPTELRGPSRAVAEREGFEPSIQLWAVYWFSKPAPSASRPPLPKLLANLRLSEATGAAEAQGSRSHDAGRQGAFAPDRSRVAAA